MNLSELEPGSQAKIDKILIDPNEAEHFSSRLLELGFIPGSTVKCLHKAPITGNPKSYLVRGMHVALRNEEATRVSISGLKNSSESGEL